MNIDIKFHHSGIAVFSIDKTASAYINLGYVACDCIYDPEQNVNVCILTKSNSPTIELLEPYNDASPINKILQKNGITTYHICYEVEDISYAISEFRKSKFMPISKTKYSNVFNADVCFLYNADMGIIELLQTK